MPTDLPTILATLRDLHSRATPGEWYTDGLLFIGIDENGCGRGGFHLQTDDDGYAESEVVANQDLTAASHNHLPAVLDEVERLRAKETAHNNLLESIGRELDLQRHLVAVADGFQESDILRQYETALREISAQKQELTRMRSELAELRTKGGA